MLFRSELFDILSDLADRSQGRANCWDDSDVQRRLAELGIQTPQSTQAEPADVPQDTAPDVKEGMGILGEKDVAEGSRNKLPQETIDLIREYIAKFEPNANENEFIQAILRGDIHTSELEYALQDSNYGVAEGDNLATFVEDQELAHILKHAGVPIREGVLNDDTRNTWDHLLDRFRHEVEQFKNGHDLDNDLYDALFDYYSQHGAMPYGVAKAKTGDPFAWVSDRFAEDLGLNENLISPVVMPVATEGSSCNMTAEGEYCPEHGLAECGGMYEDGGAVGMPYSMGEGIDDPINSNSAMTGSYYESKGDDALLARIKSLALIK